MNDEPIVRTEVPEEVQATPEYNQDIGCRIKKYRRLTAYLPHKTRRWYPRDDPSPLFENVVRAYEDTT